MTLPSSLPPLSLLSFVSILPLLFLSLLLLPSLPIGPSRPHSPVNTTATSIRYNGAVINWIVTSIAYTPEQYTVLYGTSSNNLSQSSLVLNGSANFSITDAMLSLDLIDLMNDTLYYYKVRSTNTVGSTESDINNFRTKENSKCHKLKLFLVITIKSVKIINSCYCYCFIQLQYPTLKNHHTLLHCTHHWIHQQYQLHSHQLLVLVLLVQELFH